MDRGSLAKEPSARIRCCHHVGHVSSLRAPSPRALDPRPQARRNARERSAAPCFAGVRGVLNYLIIPLWLSFKFLDRISGQDLSNPLLGSSPGVPDSARPPAVAADWRTFGGSILGPLFGTLFFPSWSALGRLQGRKKCSCAALGRPKTTSKTVFSHLGGQKAPKREAKTVQNRGPKAVQAENGETTKITDS